MKLFTRNRIQILVVTTAIALISYFAYTNFFTAHDTIKQIDSFSRASDILSAADKNALVLFDVDDTLMMPASKVFWPRNIEKHKEWLRDIVETALKKTAKTEDELRHIWAATELPILIEPDIVPIIQSLQDRGVKVLALTAIMTKGGVPEWRFSKLKQLGIDFSRADFSTITFNELPAHDGQYPMLYKGILGTTHVSKGDVVGAFLDRTSWKPSQVIFFDDSLKRVKEVADEMHKRGIPFHGFQYLGGDHLPGKLDKEIAATQLNYLAEHEIWISEDEARELLKQEKESNPIPAVQ
jgi:hypothetical protein